MTKFGLWCAPAVVHTIGKHQVHFLDVTDEETGVLEVTAALPHMYADTSALARIAESLGKAAVSEFLRNKLPRKASARSGDLGEILACKFVEEVDGYVVGPSRLRDRDHQEWAMRGDDVLAVRSDRAQVVALLKVESKSRSQLTAATVGEARVGLDRESPRVSWRLG